MKTIGFVDYYISEWHANNYPLYIKELNEKLGTDYQVKYMWAEKYVSKEDGRNTDEWCKDFAVEQCGSIQEVCEKSDYIFLLAPNNPEKHLEYAKEVLKHKKNTYIDKTFAPDYATAKEIFDIAERYGTKFFSTSALRYAHELKDVVNSQAVITLGGGGSIDVYGIHQIEMIVKVIDSAPTAVRVEQQGSQYICSIEFENGKRATMIYSKALTFKICVDDKDGNPVYKQIESDFFVDLVKDILRFFETVEPSFNTQQTLWAMQIREAVISGKSLVGEWIKL
jgi:hypothetical protein